MKEYLCLNVCPNISKRMSILNLRYHTEFESSARGIGYCFIRHKRSRLQHLTIEQLISDVTTSSSDSFELRRSRLCILNNYQ